MQRPTQPVSIDGIEFDALINENVNHSSDIPDYPTEQGFKVSDTITLQPTTLELTLMVSNTPVTWSERLGAGNPLRVRSVLDRLEECWKKRQLITVLTHDKSYKNMGIASYSEARKGFDREISMGLKEVHVTQSKTVGIPASYGKSGKTGTGAGKISTGGGGAAGGVAGAGGKSAAYNLGAGMFG